MCSPRNSADIYGRVFVFLMDSKWLPSLHYRITVDTKCLKMASPTNAKIADRISALGSIRCHRDTPFKVSSRTWGLFASIVQEHPRDCTSYQWLEARACCEVPRERSGAQGSSPNAAICWWNWPCSARFVYLTKLQLGRHGGSCLF